MAVLDINVKTNGISKATREIKTLDAQLDKTSKTTSRTNLAMTKLIGTVASLTLAYKAYDIVMTNVIKNGLEYNNIMEQQTQGLTALIVATSADIDSKGNALTLQEKYNIAQRESISTLKELTVLNAQTPQTLAQTVQIYKTLLPTFAEANASQEDLLKITKSLANASASAGIEFNSLLAGVDGLATGTVLANSDLGRFLKPLGLTNKALKETSDVTALVIEKLKDFDVQLDNLQTRQSNFTNSWNDLTATLTKDIFEAQKTSLKQLTTLIDNIAKNKGLTKDLTDVINSVAKGAVTTIELLVQFVNGMRYTFNEISFLIESVVNGGINAFYGLSTVMLETLSTVEESINNVLDKFNLKFKGEDVRVSLVDESKLEIYRKIIEDTYKAQDKAREAYEGQNKALIKQIGLVSSIADLIRENIDTTKIIIKGGDDKDLKGLGKNEKIEFDVKINGISEAKGDLSKVIGSLDDMQKNQNKYNKFLKQTGNTEKEIAEAKALYGENQINGIQSLASASKTFFDEESTAYMTLMALETALSVQKGLTAIANAMAKGDGYTAVARGLAVASSLNSFGIALSGSGASSPESQARQEYDNFSDAVDKMVDALEEFGNQGTATATVLESNLAKIASLQVAKEQANYNITSRYREEFNDYLTGGRYGGTRYIAQRPTSEAGVADVTGQINSTIDYTLSLYRDAVSDELRKSIAGDIDYSLVSEDYILDETGLSDFTDFSNQFTSMQEGLSQIGLKVKEMSRNFASESEINSYLNNGKVLIEGIGSLSAVDIYTSDIYKAGIDYEEAIENINELREEEMQTLADLAEATKEADKSIQDTINSILGLSGAYDDDDTEFKRLSEFNRLIAEYGSTTGEDKADVLDDILSLSTILSSNSNIQGAIVSRLQGLQSTSDSQILSDVVSAEAQTLELEQASNLELEKVNANLEENNINTLSLEQRMRNIEDLLLQLSNGGQSLKMEMVG
jgi:hypothetical protein